MEAAPSPGAPVRAPTVLACTCALYTPNEPSPRLEVEAAQLHTQPVHLLRRLGVLRRPVLVLKPLLAPPRRAAQQRVRLRHGEAGRALAHRSSHAAPAAVAMAGRWAWRRSPASARYHPLQPPAAPCQTASQQLRPCCPPGRPCTPRKWSLCGTRSRLCEPGSQAAPAASRAAAPPPAVAAAAGRWLGIGSPVPPWRPPAGLAVLFCCCLSTSAGLEAGVQWRRPAHAGGSGGGEPRCHRRALPGVAASASRSANLLPCEQPAFAPRPNPDRRPSESSAYRTSAPAARSGDDCAQPNGS